jgi:hypothetical protein
MYGESETECDSRPGSWLVAAVAAVLFLLVLYVLSWGPVASLAARSTMLDDVAQTAYGPVFWVKTHTSLDAPLDWYWELFSFIRPPPLPRINSIFAELQYFQPDPGFKLKRQVKALEEYRLRQQIGPAAERSADDALPGSDGENAGDIDL